MRSLLVIAFAFGLAGPALATEPEGCDKFKWPIEADRAALSAPNLATAEIGSAQSASAKAINVLLKPLDAAGLPMQPEKARGVGNFAGFLNMAAPSTVSTYVISTSSGVWIDVIQDGKFLRPVAFSGATGCAGIRKTMRFELAAQPYVVQISGGAEPNVALLIRPAD